MAKKDDKSSSSHLSEEDAKLWQKFSATAQPLSQQQRNRANDFESEFERTLKREQPRPKQSAPAKKANTQTKFPAKPARPEPKKPPIENIDRKKVRKLGSDQITIDATLDLHGYRQEQAHTTLRSFIRNCQVRDFRYVLIITGKGATTKNSSRNIWDAPEPGVLKRNVPMWLSDVDMRDYVVGYTKAHQKHGGDGALYVQIRKMSKKK